MTDTTIPEHIAQIRARNTAARGYVPPEPTTQQAALTAACEDFLTALDTLVPTNVAHYAVEGARAATRTLLRAHTGRAPVHTHDTRPRPRTDTDDDVCDDDVCRCTG